MKKPTNRLPKAPRKDELDSLLAIIRNPRDFAIVVVMAFCGLRVSEVCNLLLEWVCWTTDTPYLRILGKGNKERIVPLNNIVQDALRAWLQIRGTNTSPYLFLSRNHGRLSRKTIWKMLMKACKHAGIRHISPHPLRHFFGTTLADRGVPIERIAELMGHSDVTTSQIYITVSAEQKKAAVEKIDRRPRLLRWWSRMRNKHFRFFPLPAHRQVAGRPRTVGRTEELRQLQENADKCIDTLLVGPIGSGKSHLLELLKGENIIRVKSFSPVKEAIIALAEELHRKGILKIENANQNER